MILARESDFDLGKLSVAQAASMPMAVHPVRKFSLNVGHRCMLFVNGLLGAGHKRSKSEGGGLYK
jgi:hypothetical protein